MLVFRGLIQMHFDCDQRRNRINGLVGFQIKAINLILPNIIKG